LDAFCSFRGQRKNVADLFAEKDPKVISEAVKVTVVTYFKIFANIAFFAIFFMQQMVSFLHCGKSSPPWMSLVCFL
jgi:hypothetical protein